MTTVLLIILFMLFVFGWLLYSICYIWLYANGWQRWTTGSFPQRRKYWLIKDKPRTTMEGGIWKPFLIQIGIAKIEEPTFGEPK